MCDFCDVIKGKKKREILYKDKNIVVFLGSPHHLGHTDVVLRKHKEDFTKLSKKELIAFILNLVKVAKVLKKVLNPDRINYQLYGNWVPHLHWHVIPRLKSDKDWGNPPLQPLKKQTYNKKLLSKEQLDNIKKELRK